MRIEIAHCLSKPFLLWAAAGAIAVTAAVTQIPSPAHTHATAAPAGREMMRLLRDEHETMRIFLAEQDAKLRRAAAIESEPGPDQSTLVADAQPAATARTAASKHPVVKPVRLAKASAAPPVSILSPPMPFAHMPPPPPIADPPRAAHGYGWVREATGLPRRLWAAVGELMDERPPIPSRPIPPV